MEVANLGDIDRLPHKTLMSMSFSDDEEFKTFTNTDFTADELNVVLVTDSEEDEVDYPYTDSETETEPGHGSESGALAMSGAPPIPPTQPARASLPEAYVKALTWRMRDEQERRYTFQDVPSMEQEFCRSLAANGFFFFNKPDKMMCAFCQVILHNWADEDVVEEQHRCWSPSCPLLMGAAGENISMGDNMGADTQRGEHGEQNVPMQVSGGVCEGVGL